MVACSQCHIQNSLDSRYCKKCGTVLPEDSLRDAQSELGRLVAQGFVLFNEGKIEEARKVADLGLQQNPSLTTAISLKGMCHERRDELAEALDCYEQVLGIQPDSALDRIKVTQLRSAIAERAQALEEKTVVPDRRRAFAIAGLAVVTVVGMGALAGAFYNSANKTNLVQNQTQQSPIGTSFDNPSTQQIPTPTDTSATVTGQGSPGVTPAVQPEAKPAVTDPSHSKLPTALAMRPSTSTSSTEPALPDLDIKPEGTLTQQGQPPVKTQNDVPILPKPKPADPDPSVEPAKSNVRDEDPGTIEINVTSTRPANQGGGQEVESAPSSESLAKAASNDFQLRRYDSAAKNYEKMTKQGAGSARVHQRLGQCYENLGRPQEALEAYKRAAKALKAQVSSGKASERDKAALASVDAAIKVLGGGA